MKPWNGPTGRDVALARHTTESLARPEVVGGPKVVVLGGGHGVSVALQATRHYAGEITAVVSVADDGGSSGRLRRDLGIPAPGDLRKCLVALAADDSPWPEAFEHRFGAGELAGHALGNLVLVGLLEALGDLTAALDEAGHLLGAVGRVLPATADPITMTAVVGDERVAGQVAIAEAGRHARIEDVAVVPPDAHASPDALAAIQAADQIVLAPGSLFTSIVAVLRVPEIAAALSSAPGQVVQICNLATENETTGLDGTDHLRAVLAHGGRVDTFLYDDGAGLAVDDRAVEQMGVHPVAAPIAGVGGPDHVAEKVAKALAALL